MKKGTVKEITLGESFLFASFFLKVKRQLNVMKMKAPVCELVNELPMSMSLKECH